MKRISVRLLAFVVIILCASVTSTFAQVTRYGEVNGTVVDAENRDILVGVNIVVKETGEILVTDINGKFKLLVPDNGYTLSLTYVGYKQRDFFVKPARRNVTIQIRQADVELDEVVISAQRPDHNVKSTDLGKNVIEIETMKDLPPLAGEVDVLKAMTLLPGVSTVGEASSGFNVRGGGFDQNLILLGGGILYNPSHFFGFFSSINAEVVDNITLYKGVIPSRYGGRSSSVVDIDYKVGDYRKWGGNVGVGIASSKFSLTGPIIKDKLSISLAGRASYVNWLLSLVDNKDIRNSSANFYDVNGKIDYRPNDSNHISYSIYKSRDNFNLASDTVNQWSNLSQVLRWKRTFNDKLDLNVAVVESIYDFSILNETGVNDFELKSDIIDRSAKLDVNYALSDYNTINVGVEAKFLTINPGQLTNDNSELPGSDLDIETERGREYAAFFYNTHDLFSEKVSISYGLRYNLYQYVGDKTVNEYTEFFPRSDENIIGTRVYGKNEVIKTYRNFAPRFGVRVALNETTSLKGGVNFMNQYVQLVSNTATLSPVNIWKLSDSYLRPQEVVQYSLGIFKNLSNNTFETSFEVYYKDIDNIIEYKDGAELLLNENIETELLGGIGKAYGAELFLKKKTGRLTGWASYTFSRSLRKVEGAFFENQVNNGKWYASNFDKPHDFTFVTNYKPHENLTFSTIFTYSTGRPVTYPTDKFTYFGEEIAYFDSRNDSRIPDYHRLDLSLTWKFKSNVRLLAGDWTLAIYNVYGRTNAYSVFFDDVQGAPPQAYQLSVINAPVPSLGYSVNF